MMNTFYDFPFFHDESTIVSEATSSSCYQDPIQEEDTTYTPYTLIQGEDSNEREEDFMGVVLDNDDDGHNTCCEKGKRESSSSIMQDGENDVNDVKPLTKKESHKTQDITPTTSSTTVLTTLAEGMRSRFQQKNHYFWANVWKFQIETTIVLTFGENDDDQDYKGQPMYFGKKYQFSVVVQDTCHSVVQVGVASTAHALDFDGLIGDQKGGWSYASNGVARHANQTVKSNLPTFSNWTKLTFVLDLTTTGKNGTLHVILDNDKANTIELFQDMKSGMQGFPFAAFFPVHDCDGGAQLLYPGLEEI